MTLMLIVLGLITMVVLGVPVAFALGMVGLIGILLSPPPLEAVPLMIYNSAETYALVAIPMFMLMGAIVERSGLGRILVDFASSLVGWMRGGLAHVNTVVSLLFAGMNGSAAADVASIGSILIPEMKRRGYPASFAAAITSNTSELAIIIPPSIVLIVYGVLANVSIAQLFLAGVIPGLAVASAYMLVTYAFAVHFRWPIHEPFRARRVVQTGRVALPSLMIPVVILGGILGGIFTATESAAIAVAVAALLAVLLYRAVTWRMAWEILILTAKRTAVVMLIIAASGTLAWYLAHERVPQAMADSLLALTDNYVVLLLIIDLFLILIGTMISGIPAMVIVVPVFLPVVLELGVDPIQFGIIFALAIGIGTQTPPVAATMLLTCVIANVSILEMWRFNRWLILLSFVMLVIVTFVPAISLALPRMVV
jgi:C4-dicarboxylate transporter, DctM subunit